MSDKKGYRVVTVAPEGFADMDLPNIDRLCEKESEINDIAYIGVAISYSRAESRRELQSDVLTENVSRKRNVSYTQAMDKEPETYGWTGVGDSAMSCPTLDSLTTWETPPHLYPMRIDPAGNDMNFNYSEKSMPVLSPAMTRYPNNRDKDESYVDSTDVDTDGTSFVTALSETFSMDRCESVFNNYHSAILDDVRCLIDSEIDEEYSDAQETPFNNTDVDITDSESMPEREADVNEITDTNWQIDENYYPIMKLRKMNDLNNRIHYAGKQNVDNPRTVLGNIFVNGREENMDENKENNNSYGMTKDEIGSLYKKDTKSNAMVLDMQKYLIQKENVTDKNCENKNLNVDCSDCTTRLSRDSQLECPKLLESEPQHPLESFFKKRHDITSKAGKNIMSCILCGCSVSKTPDKRRKTSKHKKKTSSKGRLFIGFSWKL